MDPANLELNVVQAQKLVMTPELKQAVTILQLSTTELCHYLEQAILENPLLEVKEEGEVQEIIALDDLREQEDWKEYFQDQSDLGEVKVPREEKEKLNYENFLAIAPTLTEHLCLQLQLAASSKEEERIGKFLIGNLDEQGYLRLSVEEAATYLNVSPKEVQCVLELIQTFDPPGVGARNLEECLRIQLRQQEDYHPQTEKIISFYLRDLAAGRLGKIAKELKISLPEVQEAANLIRTLDPKPGRKFAQPGEVRYIVPDVILEKSGNNYVVLINDVSLPRLGINAAYQSLLQGECDEETRKFIEGRLNAATWLLRNIEQRRLTLYRVAKYLVDFQKEFLEKGVKYLRPLTLRQVAEVLGIHESTVSRTTANKYLQAPQGFYPLKFFFANGFEVKATKSIKKMIAEYVFQEDPQKPLTDQEIALRLNAEGIPIARRTVAKYRDELGIPPACRRRKQE